MAKKRMSLQLIMERQALKKSQEDLKQALKELNYHFEKREIREFNCQTARK